MILKIFSGDKDDEGCQLTRKESQELMGRVMTVEKDVRLVKKVGFAIIVIILASVGDTGALAKVLGLLFR